MQLSLFNLMPADGIQHPIDIGATTWRGVHFRYLHILVDGDSDRNLRKGEDLGQRRLHDDEIHESQTIEIPSTKILVDECAIVLCPEQGGAEKALGKFAVLVVAVFREELLRSTFLLFEMAYGLQHERIDNAAVVVPVEAFLLQQLVEVFVLDDDFPVQLAPQFLVIFIGRSLRQLHIFLIYLRLRDELVKPSHEVLVIGPRPLLVFYEIPKLSVALQLHHELVVDEAGAGG